MAKVKKKKPSGKFTWRYGVVNMGTKKEPWFELREVHMSGKKVTGHSAPVIGSEEAKDVEKILKLILKDVKTSKVIKAKPLKGASLQISPIYPV